MVVARWLAGLLLVGLLNLACAHTGSDHRGPYRVLVLNSFRTSLPVNVDQQHGLARGFSSDPDVIVEIDSESPDLTRIAVGQEAEGVRDYLQETYQFRRPHLLMATGTPALEFLLQNAETLFPGVPIVFVGVNDAFVEGRHLPPGVTGITDHVDIAGTLELALRIHPETEQFALIIGAGEYDRSFEPQVAAAFGPFEDRVRFVWLRGLPIDELQEAVGKLPERTVILYLVQFSDRNGTGYVPKTLIESVSKTARVPVYGLWDTLLGHGIVGGRLMMKEEDGYQAARMALRILQGEPPASMPIVYRHSNPAIVDKRALTRWNIEESDLPLQTQVRNRHVSLWERYPTAVVTVGSVILLQGFLIAGLMINRRQRRAAEAELIDEIGRRRVAETAAADLRSNLARFSKERSLGTMATAIAHEINQPLIAIQNYAQAVKRRLLANMDDRPKLVELLGKLESEAGRAGAITQRIRNIVSRENGPLRPASLDKLVNDVIGIIEPEAQARRCRLDWRPTGELPEVLADELEVQLVLVNLVQNAMQSVEAGEAAPGRIEIEAHAAGDRDVQVSVTDWGPGVPADQMAGIFGRLHSSKKDGMGMGLAICEAIMEAHDGRIWHEPNPDGGAIFRFTLRAVQP